MSVLFRCRIEKALLDKANEVTDQLGTSTAEMFRIFVAQIARTGKVPLKLETQADDLVDREHRNQVLGSLDDSESWGRLYPREHHELKDRRGRFEPVVVAKIKDAIRWALDLGRSRAVLQGSKLY